MMFSVQSEPRGFRRKFPKDGPAAVKVVLNSPSVQARHFLYVVVSASSRTNTSGKPRAVSPSPCRARNLLSKGDGVFMAEAPKPTAKTTWTEQEFGSATSAVVTWVSLLMLMGVGVGLPILLYRFSANTSWSAMEMV